MKVSFANIGGTRTRYYHEGTGPAVLLLHGLAVTADTWICNIDDLAREFTVYAPDLIGRGMTQPVDLKGGPPQPHEVAHLFALLDQLGVDRFSVVGGSYGGLVGALMYLQQPERVEKLIMVASGSGFNTEEQQARMLADIYAHATRAFEDVPSLEDCRRRLARVVRDPACIPEPLLYMQLSCNAQPGQADAYKKLMEGMMDQERVRQFRIIHRFAELKLPIHIINGRDDILSSWERGIEVQRLLPNATIEIWENCGHLPYVENPERFNEAVRRFLKA